MRRNVVTSLIREPTLSGYRTMHMIRYLGLTFSATGIGEGDPPPVKYGVDDAASLEISIFPLVLRNT